MHPLTQKFLEMKWQAYGKYIHLSNLLVYLVFLFLVTTFAVGILGNDTFLLTNTTRRLQEDNATIRGHENYSSEVRGPSLYGLNERDELIYSYDF